MTASQDQTSLTFYRLLRACQMAEQRFRKAADQVGDLSTKRILMLYSQQRIRFALELRQEFANYDENPLLGPSDDTDDFDFDTSTQSVLKTCADSDKKSLEEYERALRSPIPRKAHFLIASQYSLMQQVYARISNLSSKTEVTSPKVELKDHLYENRSPS